MGPFVLETHPSIPRNVLNILKRFSQVPGDPVVKTLPFHCRGKGLLSGQGTKILQAAWLNFGAG